MLNLSVDDLLTNFPKYVDKFVTFKGIVGSIKIYPEQSATGLLILPSTSEELGVTVLLNYEAPGLKVGEFVTITGIATYNSNLDAYYIAANKLNR